MIETLPIEIINYICDFLPAGKNIMNLLCTCHKIKNILKNTQYGLFNYTEFETLPKIIFHKIVCISIPKHVKCKHNYSGGASEIIRTLHSKKYPQLETNIKKVYCYHKIDINTAVHIAYRFNLQYCNFLKFAFHSNNHTQILLGVYVSKVYYKIPNKMEIHVLRSDNNKYEMCLENFDLTNHKGTIYSSMKKLTTRNFNKGTCDLSNFKNLEHIVFTNPVQRMFINFINTKFVTIYSKKDIQIGFIKHTGCKFPIKYELKNNKYVISYIANSLVSPKAGVSCNDY